jgi:hypothetical protein
VIGLLRAEFLKIFKHHKLMSFLVWIYPIGSAAFYVVVIPLSLISDGARQGVLPGCPGDWPSDSTTAWGMLTSFPANVFGKILPLSFMAVMFAGEYEWGTWKNVVPRSRRSSLLLAKMLALTVVVMTSFVVLSAIPAVGQSVGCRVIGASAGPALDGDSLRYFFQVYGQHSFLGIVTLLFMATFAAISALLTRSILGGLLLSWGISLIDLMSLGFLSLLRTLLSIPELLDLYVITPSYNLDNVRSWFLANQALPSVTPNSPLLNFQPSLAGSLAILATWLIGLTVLSFYVFQRQDITT